MPACLCRISRLRTRPEGFAVALWTASPALPCNLSFIAALRPHPSLRRHLPQRGRRGVLRGKLLFSRKGGATPPKPSPLGKVPKADEVGSASVKIKKHEPKRKPPIQTKQHGSDRAEGFQRAIGKPFGAPAGASPLHERRTALRTPNERNNNTEKTLICFGRWQSNVLLARLHHLARRSSLRR